MSLFLDIATIVIFLVFMVYCIIVGQLYGGGHPNDRDDPRRVIVFGLIIGSLFGFLVGIHF